MSYSKGLARKPSTPTTAFPLLGTKHPAALVFMDGKKAVTLCRPTVAADFKKFVVEYIERRHGTGARQTAAE